MVDVLAVHSGSKIPLLNRSAIRFSRSPCRGNGRCGTPGFPHLRRDQPVQQPRALARVVAERLSTHAAEGAVGLAQQELSDSRVSTGPKKRAAVAR